jgi:hypothetical protein
MDFRKLRANEIDVRVATVSEKGVSLLLYKDARCDMNILDESVGSENWQRNHELINGNLFCNVGIKTGSEWVWKQDVGTESYTEKEKGQASDSFKRACFNWGIGRELYTAPFIWMDKNSVNIEEIKGKKTCKDNFTVEDIEYEGNVISKLIILNEKTKKKYSWQLKNGYQKASETATVQQEEEKIFNEQAQKDLAGKASEAKKNTIIELANKHRFSVKTLLNHYNMDFETLTERQAIEIIMKIKEKYGDK